MHREIQDIADHRQPLRTGRKRQLARRPGEVLPGGRGGRYRDRGVDALLRAEGHDRAVESQRAKHGGPAEERRPTTRRSTMVV